MKAAGDDSRAGLLVFAGRFRFTADARRKIQKLFGRIQKGEKKKMNVNLIFIGDARMRDLNKRFRMENKSTDVLSFPLPQGSRTVVGEIYISHPQARRQAARFGNNLEGEVLRLTAHGLLHLLGYDHHAPAKKREMFAREEKYLSDLGAVGSGENRC